MSVGPPIADGERVWIAGEPIWVRYDPDLTVDGEARYGCADTEPTGLNSVEVKPYGALQEVTHVQAGWRRVIRLRQWDERVFLHEVLHVLLAKHYPSGHHAYDYTFIEDPKHEAAVRAIEDGLWDMGWRLFDGQSQIDPTIERVPPRAAESATAEGRRQGAQAVLDALVAGYNTVRMAPTTLVEVARKAATEQGVVL